MGSQRRINQQLKQREKRMSQLQVPGTMKFGVQNIDTPNVTPGFVPVPTGNGVQVFTIGGLTKLEHAAIELAKHLPECEADYIVERAGALLKACQQYGEPAEPAEPEEPAKSPILVN